MMTRRLFLLTVASILTCAHASADIYGEDDRYEPYELGDPHITTLSQAVAVWMPSDAIDANGDLTAGWRRYGDLGQIVLDADSGKEKLLPVGRTERFFEQPSYGSCSGFLIAPDLLVTAGHCIKGQSSCRDGYWVFGYEIDPVTGTVPSSLGPENVYRCAEVIATTRTEEASRTEHDYALIRLDREVVGRTPLEYRKSGTVPEAADLCVIGYPNGLPLKVAVEGRVRNSRDGLFFTTTLDSFGGNSGSPVIDLGTGLVEGILVRGARYDWEEDLATGRARVIHFEEDSGGTGTDVEYIGNVPELMNGYACGKLLLDAVLAADVEQARTLIESGARTERMKDSRSRNPLHLAMTTGNVELVRLLIDAGVSRTARDDAGNTPLHYAALHGFLAGAKELTAKRLPINVTNSRGATPYYYATTVAQEFRRSIQENERKRENRHDQVAAFLIQKGARTDLAPGQRASAAELVAAVRSADASAVRRILADPQVDVNAGNGLALRLACYHGLEDVARTLIFDDRTDVNLGEGGRNALFHAIGSRNTALMTLLLESGQQKQAHARQLVERADAEFRRLLGALDRFSSQFNDNESERDEGARYYDEVSLRYEATDLGVLRLRTSSESDQREGKYRWCTGTESTATIDFFRGELTLAESEKNGVFLESDETFGTERRWEIEEFPASRFNTEDNAEYEIASLGMWTLDEDDTEPARQLAAAFHAMLEFGRQFRDEPVGRVDSAGDPWITEAVQLALKRPWSWGTGTGT